MIPNILYKPLVLVILEGIFPDKNTREVVFEKISGQLSEKLGDNLDIVSCSQVQSAVAEVIYSKIMA